MITRLAFESACGGPDHPAHKLPTWLPFAMTIPTSRQFFPPLPPMFLFFSNKIRKLNNGPHIANLLPEAFVILFFP
jgi:hypothetical protein